MDYITLTFRISSKTIKPSERESQGAVTLRTPTGFGSRKVAVSTISSLAQNAQDLLSGLLAHQFPLSEASHQESWNYRLKMPNNRRFILAMTSCTSCHLAKSHNSRFSRHCPRVVRFLAKYRSVKMAGTKHWAIPSGLQSTSQKYGSIRVRSVQALPWMQAVWNPYPEVADRGNRSPGLRQMMTNAKCNAPKLLFKISWGSKHVKTVTSYRSFKWGEH